MYSESYRKNIDLELGEVVNHLEEAATAIEESEEYMDGNHVFHARAVSQYNTIVTMLINLDRMYNREEARTA